MAAPQRWWLVAKANPINRSKAFNGQLSFLTFICVSTMHKGYPHTVNSPLYSDWKNCRWIMFYIKVQSVRREPGSPPTHVSYDINICDSLFSCSCKKSSNISYKTNPETCLQKKKISPHDSFSSCFFLIKLYLKVMHSAQSFYIYLNTIQVCGFSNTLCFPIHFLPLFVEDVFCWERQG